MKVGLYVDPKMELSSEAFAATAKALQEGLTQKGYAVSLWDGHATEAVIVLLEKAGIEHTSVLSAALRKGRASLCLYKLGNSLVPLITGSRGLEALMLSGYRDTEDAINKAVEFLQSKQ